MPHHAVLHTLRCWYWTDKEEDGSNTAQPVVTTRPINPAGNLATVHSVAIKWFLNVLIARSALSALCWCGAQYCMLIPLLRANDSNAALVSLSSL